MAHSVTETFTLPVDADTAIAYLTDDAWLSEIADTYDITQAGDAIITSVTRSIAVDVPPVARTFVTSPVTIRETRTWPNAGDGTIDIVFVGLPVHAAGSLRCADVAGGCRVVVDVQITANVPMFAAMAEQAVAAEMQRIIAAEGATAGQRLSGR